MDALVWRLRSVIMIDLLEGFSLAYRAADYTGNLTIAVTAHGAVVHVCATHHHHLVVHDEELGVHVDLMVRRLDGVLLANGRWFVGWSISPVLTLDHKASPHGRAVQ